MRTKFRIWDKTKNMYLPEDIMALTNGPKDAFAVMVKDWEDYRQGEYAYPYAQEVEFFTGKTDKNGKDIYLGDICKLTPKNEYFKDTHMYGIKQVDWNYNDACFEYSPFINMDWGGFQSVEVIGNIHQNPELL